MNEGPAWFQTIESFAGLMWYAKCKKDALARMRRFVPPTDSFELRMAYSQYFVNLLSLIDQAKEIFKGDFEFDWKNSLEIKWKSGDLVNQYLRDVRNAIIHRGFDATNAAEVVGGYVLPLSPLQIPNRQGRMIGHTPPAKYLLQIAFACEESASEVILRHAQPSIDKSNSVSLEVKKQHIHRLIYDNARIPDKIKSFILEKFDEIVWSKIFENDHNSLREILRPDNE